jgi:hypothetical protein
MDNTSSDYEASARAEIAKWKGDTPAFAEHIGLAQVYATLAQAAAICEASSFETGRLAQARDTIAGMKAEGSL